MKISNLGWNDFFENQFQKKIKPGYKPGRVINRQKGKYRLISEHGEISAKLSGKFLYQSEKDSDYPVVGDWVIYQDIVNSSEQGLILSLLQRENSFARKLPISGGRKIRNGRVFGGITEKDILAANIDTVFIVGGMDNEFDIGRFERYLTLIIENKLEAVLVLNKVDLCSDYQSHEEKLIKLAGRFPVFSVSAATGFGMDILNKYIKPGNSLVFLGSSGVGKSTIINHLFKQEIQKTKSISSASGKGRHTTTSSDLLIHKSGCMVIDTPGMKELQLWAEQESLDSNYEDITDLALNCKFSNCRHDSEPGCAIRQAIAENQISEKRFDRYKKQTEEISILDQRKAQYYKYQNAKMKRKC